MTAASNLICELRQYAQEHLLEPKWVLAPSLRVGHQWLESVVRGGQPVVNFHVLTIPGLALQVAGPQLAEQQKRLLTAQAGTLLVDSLLERVEPAYLNRADRSPNLSQAVFSSIQAMRLAGVGPEELESNHFEVAGKGADLRAILGEYLRQLEVWRVVDQAGVLMIAIDRLRRELWALPDEVLLLIPDVVRPTGLAASLLAAIAQSKRRYLPDQAADEPPETDRCLLRWLREPAEAPEPIRDNTVEIFRAVGAVNEVREVLRRCVGGGIKLDCVEVLHTNTEAYVPLFYELARRLAPEDDSPEIPVTFAEGIPAAYGRPGRALRAWLAWIEQDFDQQALVRMLHEGLLVVDAGKAEIALSSLTAMLRQIGIGWGRDRYLPMLDEQLKAAQRQLKAAKTVIDDDDAADARLPLKSPLTPTLSPVKPGERGLEPKPTAVERHERRIAGLKTLRRLVARLLGVSDERASAAKLLGNSIEFLEKHARSVSEVDNYAREALVEEIRAMIAWVELAGESARLDVLGWLRELPERVRILGSGPRPGCLHVAHVLSGGHSGRPNTFIIGLDDSRFPGTAVQDPLLLDRERDSLSKALVKSSDQLEESLRAFIRNVTRLPGQVTLGYPCWDLVDDRELFPSPIILSAFRIISGKRDADQHDLDRALPPPASFAGDNPDRALDEAEWWLSQLCGERPVTKPLQTVHQRFAHLARGHRAAAARQSDALTAFDGYVPEAGTDFDPATSQRVFSAKGLETVGQCPLKYFFSYPLYIRPLEELVVDPERWLDALMFGQLLHSVFRQFMAQLHERGVTAEFARDERALAEILRSHIRQYRAAIPPPNEAAFRKQCRELTWAAKVFLETESEYCKRHRPEFFEAAIGLPAEGEGSELDQSEPVEIALPDGRSVKTCGRIDRIDRIGSGLEFSICDYKTGSSWKYDQADPFRQGRVVQSAIYLGIVEPALRRKLGAKAAVRSFCYFFPNTRTWGERITWSRRQLAEGLPIIQRLCRSIANGAFLPTDDEKDCNYCEYKPVCGDVRTLAANSRAKIDNEDNVPLIPLRELRRRDK